MQKSPRASTGRPLARSITMKIKDVDVVDAADRAVRFLLDAPVAPIIPTRANRPYLSATPARWCRPLMLGFEKLSIRVIDARIATETAADALFFPTC